MRKYFVGIIALLMFVGAVAHFFFGTYFYEFIPRAFPAQVSNFLAGVIEIIIFPLIVIPKRRKWGAILFIGLMTFYLPLHILDALKEEPVIGSHPIAYARIALQLIYIYMGIGVLIDVRRAKRNAQ